MPRRGSTDSRRNTWRMDLCKITVYDTLRVGQYVDQSSSHGLEKIGEDILTSPEVIRAQTLHFKANFKFSRLNFFGGTTVPVVVCAIKPWSISSACKKIWRASTPKGRNVVSQKSRLWSIYIRLNNFFSFMDRSTQNFFDPTWKGWLLINYFSDFRYVDPFRRYSWSKSKVVRNRENFGRFLALLIFFCGGPSKNCTHLITPASWHVVWKSFMRILPLARKLLSLTRWILGPILNFHD